MEKAESDVSRVLVAMSGGVDSSVAAALLVDAGHDVIGVTMKTFCYSDIPAHGKTCCGLDGIMDAKRVASALGIPHYVFDVEEDFTRDVIDDFVSEYARGRTPNPCVRCNSNTKFRDLLARGEAGDAEHAVIVDHFVVAACERAIERGEDDEWTRPTLLGAAFRSHDLGTARKLADRVEDEGIESWKLDSTIDDLEDSVQHAADTPEGRELAAICADLQSLLEESGA